MRQPGSLAVYLLAITAARAAIAWQSPLPDRVTDRGVYEATASRTIVPDCTDFGAGGHWRAAGAIMPAVLSLIVGEPLLQ